MIAEFASISCLGWRELLFRRPQPLSSHFFGGVKSEMSSTGLVSQRLVLADRFAIERDTND